MVPASLLGIDLERFVQHARAMEHACYEPGVSGNPGASLGALMAAGVQNGRDKLTLLLPDRLESFGLWVEQLVAESTGKAGTGVVPIAADPTDTPIADDRLVVAINVGSERVDPDRIERVRREGVPLAVIEAPETLAVGAEFLRWEIATAAAGFLLGINPFDEPNVQQAKNATRALLEVYASQHRLPMPEPIASIGGARLSLSHAATEGLGGDDAAAFLRLLKPRDYFCLLAYVPPDDERFDAPLRDFRARVADGTGCASMFGYGPRYLHSTGQLHKGGPNTGVFLILTTDADADLPVPDAPFTFGVLEAAQALGDFQSLERTGRRALHVHLPDRNPDRLSAVAAALLKALTGA
jgi:glucose-6-phosphate isomerase/transaldolase/glucose-6-phosphate isomerase